jgi:hypothetical protein
VNRSIVIYHPDFDLPGKEGIEKAKSMAEDLQLGNRQYLAALKEQGAPAAAIVEAERFLSELKFYIRKVDI